MRMRCRQGRADRGIQACRVVLKRVLTVEHWRVAPGSAVVYMDPWVASQPLSAAMAILIYSEAVIVTASVLEESV